jgi:hypothetical protein
MNKIIVVLLMINYSYAIGQVEIPFFEQIAFDFYKDSLLTKFPVKKRIKIPKYTINFHDDYHKFQVNNCLTGELLTDGKELEVFGIYVLEQMDFDSPTHVMKYDNINKKQFRVKQSKSKNYPNLRISLPHHKKADFEDYYLIITENHKRRHIDYYLWVDIKGKIKNWCRNESKSIIIH